MTNNILGVFLAICVLIDLHNIDILQKEIIYYKNLLQKEQEAFSACKGNYLNEYQQQKSKELKEKLGYK